MILRSGDKYKTKENEAYVLEIIKFENRTITFRDPFGTFTYNYKYVINGIKRGTLIKIN